MPLLCTNKNRVTRVFQIVADLQSSKRASSFTVQTGFPTSLIDLLIKNRTRFTKPNSNKPSHPPPQKIPSFNDCKVDSAEPDHTESQHSTQLITDDGVCRVGKSNDGSGSKSVLVTLFMMLVVFVSIVSFDKLVVGTTVSAFVLLFLEYAMKHDNEEIKVVVTDSLSFEEIEVVGVSSEDTSSCDGVKLDCVMEDKKLNCSEKVVDSCKVSLHEKNKLNNSVKFKSMLKKLTKKLQGTSRKEEKQCKVESRIGEDGCSNNVEKDFELKEEVVVVDSGSKSPLLVTSEVKRVDSVGNSDYVILFGIALVGLVLGRFPALILTMTWCLMVKIAAVRGRSKKPLIKSSVPNS